MFVYHVRGRRALLEADEAQAERDAGLASALGGAVEQRVGEVGAGDEQHEQDRTQQGEQRVAVVTEVGAEGNMAASWARLDAGQPRPDPIQVRMTW